MSQQIGELLKSAREAKGITLDELERETKIRKTYLEALERGNFEALPGKVYIKGFIRSYAKYVDLNGEELVDMLKNAEDENEPEPIPIYHHTSPKNKESMNKNNLKRKNPWKIIVAVGGILTLIIVQFVWQIFNDISGTENDTVNKRIYKSEKTEVKSEPPANINQEPQANLSPANQVQYNNAHLEINAKQGYSWIKVITDGNVAFEGNIKQGEIKTFDANENIYIHAGNAGALEITFNGQNQGILGNMGQVVKKEFVKPAQ